MENRRMNGVFLARRLFLAVLVVLMLSSCSDLLDAVQDPDVPADGLAYLHFTSGNVALAAQPQLDDFHALSFSLKGIRDGGEEQNLGTWSDYASMESASVAVLPGDWSFTLSASRQDVIVLVKTIFIPVMAGANRVDFGSMEYLDTGTGSIEVEFKFPGNSGVGKVVASLYHDENDSLVANSTQELTDTITTVDGVSSVTYRLEAVPTGSYRIRFTLSQSVDPSIIDEYGDTVEVAPNLTSTATLSKPAVNSVYKLDLNLDGGTYTGSGDLPTSYNHYEALELPLDVQKTGYCFAGWYETDVPDVMVTKISVGSVGNKSFAAKWVRELYVDGVSGEDFNLGTNPLFPLASLDTAIAKIKAANDGTSSYIINVTGDIVDSGTASYDAAANHALVNIVSDKPLNLTIQSGTPNVLHTINASRTATNTGRVMYVGPNVTLSLKNLVVTGGYAADINGGGIYVLDTVASLELDNCEIIENIVENGSGGGLFIGYNSSSASNKSVTLKGTKVNRNTIRHRSNVTTYYGAGIGVENCVVSLVVSENSQISNNVADMSGSGTSSPQVGGIGLWLGNAAETTISDTVISGNTLVPLAVGGGSKCQGGGVMIAAGTLKLNAGVVIEKNIISSATALSQGGGIYMADGKVEMYGGTVRANESLHGGGVYLAKGAVTTPASSTASVDENKAEYGGGFFLENGDVTVSGSASVNANTSQSDGGGFYLTGGTVTLSGNSTVDRNVSSQQGGGFYLAGGIVSLSEAASISYNDASSDYSRFGLGVLINKDAAVLDITGGTISNNGGSKGGEGTGIMLFKGSVNLGANAYIDSSNDIDLYSSGNCINITSSLAKSPVATITPSSYTDTTSPLVQVDPNANLTLAIEAAKFAVTQNPQEASKTYIVGSNGCLATQ